VAAPPGSRNKMPRDLKEMIVGVAEEVGRVDHKDWDKLLCGEDDGTRGYLKFLAIRQPATFSMLMCRCIPSPKRASLGRAPPQRSKIAIGLVDAWKPPGFRLLLDVITKPAKPPLWLAGRRIAGKALASAPPCAGRSGTARAHGRGAAGPGSG